MTTVRDIAAMSDAQVVRYVLARFDFTDSLRRLLYELAAHLEAGGTPATMPVKEGARVVERESAKQIHGNRWRYWHLGSSKRRAELRREARAAGR